MYIEIKARSFMWGQIRIMVQTCLKYAKGHLTLNDMNRLFEPEDYRRLESGKEWHKSKVSPHGLYLTDVQYPADIFA